VTGALRPARDHDELRTEARLLGLDPDELAPARQDGVWPVNCAAVDAFLAVASQRRMVGAGLGGVVMIGLDYAGAEAGLRLAGIEVTPELWAQVRVIEAAARDAMNERQS